MKPHAEHKKAVLKVGDGRGFVVEADGSRVVITASHCLPHLPPNHGASFTEERTYGNLLGLLDERAPNVWAECLFADPVADVAVLGSPDGQKLYDEATGFETLTNETPILRIGEAENESSAWLLTVDGRWVRCTVRIFGRSLWIENAVEAIQFGMSGSPILNGDADAIGVVCLGGGSDFDSTALGGPNPRLTHNLPAWVLL